MAVQRIEGDGWDGSDAMFQWDVLKAIAVCEFVDVG
jgi:hypothetical protein